jgi:arsenite methyltransferase
MASFITPSVDESNWSATVTTACPQVKVVLATAGWNATSQALIKDLKSSLASTDCNVHNLDVSEDDEIEELAIELDLTAIPSAVVYVPGSGTVFKKLDGADCTASNVADAVAGAGAVDHREFIRQAYAATVNKKASCCVSVDSKANGYSHSDLMAAGAADLGVGCGNPLSFAAVKAGETVLDLGSGAGIDCFIASERVGAEGKVIGVDMTPDMLSTARASARAKNVTNVSFRLGEIEHLPVADGTVDVVISNCVINLSDNKPQVLREAYRVLKSGGRFCVCDVVTREGLTMPSELKTQEALAC